MISDLGVSALEGEIRSYLDSSASPLHVFRIINLGPGHTWNFEVSMHYGADFRLSFVAPIEIDVATLLNGSYPEISSASAIQIDDDTITSGHSGLGILQVASSITIPKGAKVGINNILRPILHPEWQDAEQIQRFLQDATWLGSSLYSSHHATYTITVLGTQVLSFSPKVHKLVGELPDVRVAAGDHVLVVKPDRKKKGFSVRHPIFGGLELANVISSISSALRASGISGGTLEIPVTWPIRSGTCARVYFYERMDTLFAEMRVAINASHKIREAALATATMKMREEASRLNMRIAEISAADLIYVGETLIGTVPRSEQGAVAVWHKLEALGAVPFQKFVSMGWAGADGIDAIADFQESAAVPVSTNAPVEYEYEYGNFLKHRHPHEHVKLVACWSLGGNPEQLGLVSGGEPWLYRSVGPKHNFPVAVMQHMPTITVRKR